MRIILDNIIFNLQKSGGISVVWYELLSRLFQKNIAISCLSYENDNLFAKQLPQIEHFTPRKKKLSFLPIKRYLNLPLSTEKSPFLFHSSYYRYSTHPHAINITTVHDFTYAYFETGFKKFLHLWQIKKAILNSDYVICISENTKKDMLKFIPSARSKNIKVIYNGVSEDYHVIPSPVENIVPFPPKTFVVFVGARSGYKNFDFAVSALQQLTYSLVIVGNPLSKEEESLLDQKLGKDRYHYAGRIPNRQLNVIYNTAFALLYPSSYEGFGIPVIEAQKAGCPIIALNTSSIPEIVGDTSLLMQELSISEMKRCINRLENVGERNHIIQEGMTNSQRFTWDKMFDQVMDLYHEAWMDKGVQSNKQ